MKNRFALDTRLQNDTDFVIDLQLCTVRLMNDAQYPWLILVPQVADVSELHHLTETQQSLLNQDSNLTSVVLTEVFNPETLNIAALGNIVRQLHIHHVARYSDDPAWPGPIWGKQPVIQYDSKVKLKLINTLQEAFARLA
ncbi:HIT domain-containing protein [Alteromonas sp. LMIT006]|uniref:HIT domain-containing protein n=1 Tax=Alteromonadaceae TaxID=72275 RepID=UPI0020CA2956|nr:HIT domain-containing protein [Alteromonas sp. LMIT006]UTP72215.1 HIT domain-containing protein [Alteromonas sp. LMIT006]